MAPDADSDARTDEVTGLDAALDDPDTLEDARIDAAVRRRLFGGEPKPETIDRFVLLSKLGEGGFGSVYAAYDPRLDRRVALKVLRAPIESRGGEVALTEARTLARLQHPNVVAIHDAIALEDGRIVLAMEHVDGRTLAEHVRGGEATLDSVVKWFDDLTAGVVAVHAHGIVHRDIKPTNVLIDTTGRAVLADFGLAIAPEGGPTNEEGPPRAGTPGFMAPEQSHGREVDARTDVFGLCKTIAWALERARGPDGQPLRAAAPRWLDRILTRGAAPDPARRMDLTALVAALRRGRRRRRGLALGAVAIAVTAAIAGALQSERECPGAEIFAEQLVEPDRQRALEEALEGADVPYRDAIARSTLDALGERAARWGEARAEQCARERAGTEPQRLDAAARIVCLAQRRDETRALVEELATAEPRAFEGALDQVWALSPVRPCTDAPIDAIRTTEAGRSAAERVAAAMRAQLSWRPEQTARLAREARESLEEGVAPDVAAHAHLLEGWAAFMRRDFEAQREHALTSFRIASHNGLGMRAAFAASYLASVASRRGEHAEANAWVVVGDAAIGREDVSPARRWRYEQNVGELHARIGVLDEAQLRLRRAFDACGRAHPQPERCARVLVSLGGVLAQVGARTEARATLTEAKGHLARAYGVAHPLHLDAAHGLAMVALGDGDLDASQRVVDEALAAIGDQHERAPLFLNLRGQIALEGGEHERGIAALEQALEHPGLPPQGRVMTGVSLGEAYADAGDRRAEAVLQQAAETQDAAADADYAALRLGLYLVAQERQADAARWLERGVETVAPAGHGERGLGRVALARILLASDEARARALVRDARQNLVDLDPALDQNAEALRHALEAWDAAHGDAAG